MMLDFGVNRFEAITLVYGLFCIRALKNERLRVNGEEIGSQLHVYN